MNLQDILTTQIKSAVKSNFNADLESVEFQATRKEFPGDITVVVFSMLRVVKGNPVQIGESIGNYLVENVNEVEGFNVVKGFLNLEISASYFVEFFNAIKDKTTYGFEDAIAENDAVMVEYSSPNTNKPLHLGHIRNNLLGYSVAEILKASGKKVYKTQIINDRGIHICKSMLAWQKFGNNETPETTGLKGDKLVGNYYVKFDQEYKKEIENLKASGKTEDEAKKEAPILVEAQEMLKKWEAGDTDVVALWSKMNGWVYDGFDVTYKNLGVDFDKLYYESETYLLGKEFVSEGLKSGVFYKREDGSVWCDLTDDGLDEKIVLRADGTAVYMTQDIGTAIQRIKDFPDVGGMVYTVGNEQDYHFQVLFLILKKLGFDWAKNLYHLSYGMVDLPSGKMKSREGTVVDADDLIADMATTAKTISEELGKLDGYSEDEKEELYKTIGLGALKYYILKVDPKKRILFDPKESIDFQGNTGPFIQYTYARIQSILRKSDVDFTVKLDANEIELHEKERELIKQLQLFPDTVQQAAAQHSPALIANYTYDLVKAFNSFYQNVS
ncbi:MAG: arginine--tRNA ligase, partial [Mesoflavibacter sp.]|nr:arginine--tRNA ligase [Mesoflavibacter sp.]